MKTDFRNPGIGHQSGAAAFTIIELVVVVAIVALLVVLQLPALSRSARQSRAAQCAGNLRQLGLVTQIYGHEHNDQLPRFDTALGANWAWDTPVPVVDGLIQCGASRNMFYCPANPDQNANGLWNWNLLTATYVRIVGYIAAFSGPSSKVSQTNQNSSLIPQSISSLGQTYPPPPASKRVLLADVVISIGPNNTYPFTGIQSGYAAPGWQGHRTSHMNTTLPSGGNVAMLDGHVEWRPFALMIPRTSSGPFFWW